MRRPLITPDQGYEEFDRVITNLTEISNWLNAAQFDLSQYLPLINQLTIKLRDLKSKSMGVTAGRYNPQLTKVAREVREVLVTMFSNFNNLSNVMIDLQKEAKRAKLI